MINDISNVKQTSVLKLSDSPGMSWITEDLPPPVLSLSYNGFAAHASNDLVDNGLDIELLIVYLMLSQNLAELQLHCCPCGFNSIKLWLVLNVPDDFYPMLLQMSFDVDTDMNAGWIPEQCKLAVWVTSSKLVNKFNCIILNEIALFEFCNHISVFAVDCSHNRDLPIIVGGCLNDLDVRIWPAPCQPGAVLSVEYRFIDLINDALLQICHHQLMLNVCQQVFQNFCRIFFRVSWML